MDLDRFGQIPEKSSLEAFLPCQRHSRKWQDRGVEQASHKPRIELSKIQLGALRLSKARVRPLVLFGALLMNSEDVDFAVFGGLVHE